MKAALVVLAALALVGAVAAFDAEVDTEMELDAETETEAEMEGADVVSSEAEIEAEVEAQTEAEAETEADAEAEDEPEERPETRLRRPKIFGSRSQRINIVPKGDARAFPPAVAGTRVSPLPVVPHPRLSRFAPFNGQRGNKATLAPRPAGAPVPPLKPVAPATPSAPATPAPAKRVIHRLGADYAKNKCLSQGGQCQPTTTCGGYVTHGICPGPSFITCCTYTSTACAALKGSCKDTSTCAGSVVKGLCPGGNNIACCTGAGAPGAKPAPLQGGNCLANFNGKALADRAIAYTAAYRANAVRYDAKRPQYGPAGPMVTSANAASFVTSVLDSLSWNCLFSTGRQVSRMIPQMTIRGGFHGDPRLGDVAVWTKHVGVVTDACKPGEVRMASMGEHGAADTGCITLDALKGWGKGSFFGFWTPN